MQLVETPLCVRRPQGESVCAKGYIYIMRVYLMHVTCGSKYDSASKLISDNEAGKVLENPTNREARNPRKFSTVVGCNFSGIEIRVVADQNAACCVMPGTSGFAGHVQ